MKLRSTSSGTVVFLWVLLIKDVCYALELLRYPNGITAIDAIDKCDKNGLETDFFVLNKITKLHGKEIWTGLGIYTVLTSWIDILGCFQLTQSPNVIFLTSSVGFCWSQCVTRYFVYNKEDRECFCLDNNKEQLDLSTCPRKTDKADLVYMVYKTYNGTIQSSLVGNGLCTTLMCSSGLIVVMDAPCEGNSNIKGLCEDGMPSTSNRIYGLTQNQTSENCRNKNKLLLHPNDCDHLSQELTSPAWTNVFREEIESEQMLGERMATPEFCLSATFSDNREHFTKIRRHNCSFKLELFVCKNVSVSVGKTTHKDVETDSKYVSSGAVIGGILGACSMIGVVAVLIVCKVRSKVIFAKSSSDNYEDTTRVNFSTTTYDDLDNKTNRGATATSNQNCDIDEYITPVYDEVNESA